MQLSAGSLLGQFWVQWPTEGGGNGHFYSLTSERYSEWQQAADEAKSYPGGHLVSINSQQEQAFLEEAFLSGTRRNELYWIGLMDAESEGDFKWTNREPLSFINWASTEPNNHQWPEENINGEDAAVLNYHFALGKGPLGVWNDFPKSIPPSAPEDVAGPYFAIVETPQFPFEKPVAVQPQEVAATRGSSVTFSALVEEDAVSAYRWRFNGEDLDQTGPTLTLSDVTDSDEGSYSVVVATESGIFTSAAAQLSVKSVFRRVTTGPIVSDGPRFPRAGGAWADFNNNDFPDLVVPGLGGPIFLYANQGDGTFKKLDRLRVSAGAMDIAVGDYDNDGNLDLFQANVGRRPGGKNALLRGHGNGNFAQVTSETIANQEIQSNGAAWADYNNDGVLDLFVANVLTHGTAKDFLYRGEGDRTFTRITDSTIVNEARQSKSEAWGDYDDDGDVDLFVGHEGQNSLFRNEGGGNFVKITSGPIPNDEAANSASASWVDLDNDRDLDLFVVNNQGTENFLYINQGNGQFLTTPLHPLVNVENVRSATWGDFDNDGLIDVFMSAGGRTAKRNKLFRNTAGGLFTEISAKPVTTNVAGSAGAAWADIERDGDLDLFVANLAGGRKRNWKNALYINESHGNNWLRIKTVGTFSNRSAIGAEVHVKAEIRGETFWQMRHVSGDSPNSLNAHFGLGDAEKADLVRI